jgi:hypothetical protein
MDKQHNGKWKHDPWRYSTLLDATLRYSTLLDATRRYLTLLDAIWRHSMLLYTTRRYSMLLDATRRYSTLFNATQRYLTLLNATRHCTFNYEATWLQTWPANFFRLEEGMPLLKTFQPLHSDVTHNGPCHVNGIPLQKGFFPFCKGEKRRCLAGEERRLPFEEKKIPAHMTRANDAPIIIL